MATVADGRVKRGDPDYNSLLVAYHASRGTETLVQNQSFCPHLHHHAQHCVTPQIKQDSDTWLPPGPARQ